MGVDSSFLRSIWANNCPCYKVEMSISSTDKNIHPSLDRRDSLKGYTEDNVAWICFRCNILKSSGTAQDHEQIATWMKNRAGMPEYSEGGGI